MKRGWGACLPRQAVRSPHIGDGSHEVDVAAYTLSAVSSTASSDWMLPRKECLPTKIVQATHKAIAKLPTSSTTENTIPDGKVQTCPRGTK